MNVKSYLEAVGGGPVRAKDLSRRLGFGSVRELQKQIAVERADGAVILTDGSGNGYYLSDDPVELAKFVRLLNAKARNTALAAESARRALDDITGQTRMEGA